MELTKAQTIAEGLAAQMRPYCLRVQVAGSIRRRKDEVKDIEIVAIPRREPVASVTGTLSLFGEGRVEMANALHRWATESGLRWIKPNTNEIVDWRIKPEGKYWRALLPCGIKLDLFLATPENFGLIHLIRTGSAEFSQAVVTYAKHRTNFRVMEGHLVDKGSERIIHVPEERDVFGQLGIDWIEPHERTGQHVVMRNGRAQFPRTSTTA